MITLLATSFISRKLNNFSPVFLEEIVFFIKLVTYSFQKLLC